MHDAIIGPMLTDSVHSAMNSSSPVKSGVAIFADYWGFQDIWMFALTVGLFVGVLFQLWFNRKTIQQMEKVAGLEVGSLEIDFRAERIVQAIATEDGTQKKFQVNFSLIPSGKAMVRVISTRFDFALKDFMFMESDWDIRLKTYEAYSHKLLKQDEQLDMTAITVEQFSDARVTEICKVVEPGGVTVVPLCLWGTVKYHNGVGETWVKPFIFRFEWKTSDDATPVPWSNSVKAEKVYPTGKTRMLEFRMTHPRISRFLDSIGIQRRW